jgi:hypothetical protein
MYKFTVFFLLFLLSLVSANSATAGQMRAHVQEFIVTGAQNKDELKGTLQTLFASRINGDVVKVVDAAGADVVITGNYTLLGKIFSIDAVARDSKGTLLTRTFVQGEGEDDLIPAIGRLAQQLQQELAKLNVATASPAPAPAPAKVLPAAVVFPGVTSPEIVKAAPPGATLTRLSGALVGIAPARQLANGERELVVAGRKQLRLYRQGKELRQLAEITFPGDTFVLGVDTADLDGDGVFEAYVTLMSGESLVSQVWGVADAGFTKLAEKLPYYFRAIALDGGARRLYAQQISSDTDFYGNVFEVVKKGSAYELVNPIKLPRHGNIYNFNRFTGADGRKLLVLIDSDGYLRVHDEGGELLWTSGDRYGGSALYFKRDEQQMQPISTDRYRWRFLEQRLMVTGQGELIVPRNSGLFSIGNNRAYSRNSIFAFRWNGAALDEVWHTKESQNYLADYYYDAVLKELVMLEVVKKEGLLDKGASTIAVKKVE